jgi:hypothetical protein
MLVTKKGQLEAMEADADATMETRDDAKNNLQTEQSDMSAKENILSQLATQSRDQQIQRGVWEKYRISLSR